MKKTAKRLVCLAAAAVMTVSTGLTAFAFYQQPASKKGLLMSQVTMFDDVLALGVDQVIMNQSTSSDLDMNLPIAKNCKANGISFTMILLNSFGASDPNLLPVSEPVEGVGSYAFNSMTPEGEEAVRKYAKTIVDYYGDYVSNWVIGNEINDTVSWDYNGIDDMDQHAESYAKTFRIFYETIKAKNPDAGVYIPFDMRWRAKHPSEPRRYVVAEYLPKLNALLKDTEYGIAWHPYPVHFFTKPEFLDDDGISFDPATTPNINMKNLNVLTDYMQNADMLTPSGEVRSIILTEQGFTSACENGEERQAEAIKQAYEIAKENPHVDAFFLSRQVDAQSQVAAGGAFGLWTRDENAARDEMPLAKKKAWFTYQSLE